MCLLGHQLCASGLRDLNRQILVFDMGLPSVCLGDIGWILHPFSHPFRHAAVSMKYVFVLFLIFFCIMPLSYDNKNKGNIAKHLSLCPWTGNHYFEMSSFQREASCPFPFIIFSCCRCNFLVDTVRTCHNYYSSSHHNPSGERERVCVFV